MKTNAIFIGVFSGFAGAFLSSFLILSFWTPQPPVSTQQWKDVELELWDLSEKSAEHLAALEEIAMRIDTLEKFRPTSSSASAPRTADRDAVETMDLSDSERAAAMIRTPAVNETAPTEPFRQMVLRVMEEERERQIAQARVESEARQLERINRRVDRLQEQLQLDAYQTQEVRKILIDYETAWDDFRRQIRETTSYEDRRTLAQSAQQLRSTRNENLSRVLNEEQMKEFEQTERPLNRFLRSSQNNPVDNENR